MGFPVVSIIATIIFLIVIMVFFSMFSTVFENLYNAFADQFETAKNKSTTQAGDTVCDLRFEVFPSFDEAPFGFDLEIRQRLYLGVGSPNSGGKVYHPEVATALFRECHTKGTSLFDLSPTFTLEKIHNLQATLLAFTNITPQSFQVDMEFFKVSDGTAIGTKTVRAIEPAGAKLPFIVPNQVFVFENVELTDYNVHISCSGDCTRTNTLPSGEPYIYRIRL